MKIDRFYGFCSFVGILFGLAAYFTKEHPYHIWMIAGTSIMFCIIAAYSSIKYTNSQKYHEADISIRELHYKAISDSEILQNSSFDAIVKSLANLCSNISDIFGTLKDAEIGVCIKWIREEDDVKRPYASTVCRDSHSDLQRQNEKHNEKEDYIDANSDFSHIISLINKNMPYKELFYCMNYLHSQHQYNNTHLNGKNLTSGPWYKSFKRNKEWPLKYKSTVVVPFMSSDNKSALAFLCLDSPDSKGFNIKEDVPIIQQLSLFMTPLIYSLLTKKI